MGTYVNPGNNGFKDILRGEYVDKKNGKVTVKKGTPKGTYKFKVKVSVAGNTNYNPATKNIAVTIVVK